MKIREVRTLKVTMSESDFATLMAALSVCQREASFESVRDAAGVMYTALAEATNHGELGTVDVDPYMNAGNAANAGYEGTKLGKR